MADALQKALSEVDGLIARFKAGAIIAPSTVTSTTGKRTTENQLTAPQSEGTKSYQQPEHKAGKGKPKCEQNTAIQSTPIATGGGSPLADTFAKARLAVGKVQDVEELENSDKLYRCKVQVGGGEVRQIIAGLRKHVAKEELQGRLVVVVLNLKTAKLAGEDSQGMILAAVHKGDQHQHGELVKPISPPGSAEAGDPVFLEGSQPTDSFPKEFKHWKKILPHLSVAASKATFEGISLVTRSGAVLADTATPDGAAIS